VPIGVRAAERSLERTDRRLVERRPDVDDRPFAVDDQGGRNPALPERVCQVEPLVNDLRIDQSSLMHEGCRVWSVLADRHPNDDPAAFEPSRQSIEIRKLGLAALAPGGPQVYQRGAAGQHLGQRDGAAVEIRERICCQPDSLAAAVTAGALAPRKPAFPQPASETANVTTASRPRVIAAILPRR